MKHDPKGTRQWVDYLMKTALDVTKPKTMRRRCIKNYAYAINLSHTLAMLTKVYGERPQPVHKKKRRTNVRRRTDRT